MRKKIRPHGTALIIMVIKFSNLQLRELSKQKDGGKLKQKPKQYKIEHENKKPSTKIYIEIAQKVDSFNIIVKFIFPFQYPQKNPLSH